MAEIVNLRQMRKRKARAEDQKQAAENRARFGRTKFAKRRDEQASERLKQTLDGAHLDEE